MPQRTAKQILAEWHELAEQRLEASDAELQDAIAARIAEVRREYIEGTPASPPKPPAGPTPADEPRTQLKLPITD
jgi:hypothetical protein